MNTIVKAVSTLQSERPGVSRNLKHLRGVEETAGRIRRRCAQSFSIYFFIHVHLIDTFILLYFLLLLCLLTSWAPNKRKAVKPAPTAALRIHHCQGREHPSVRETWCVSESETPLRGGRDRCRQNTTCMCSIAVYIVRDATGGLKCIFSAVP